jgi:hypothetical protein
MNELFERIKSESPAFFKKLKAIALSLGGSALAVLAVNATTDLHLPEVTLTGIGYVVAVCAAIAGTAQLTKQ